MRTAENVEVDRGAGSRSGRLATITHRRRWLAAAAILIVVGLAATNATAVWRLEGGPLRFRGESQSPGPLHIPSGFQTDQHVYYLVPEFAEADVTIQHVELSAGPGVRLTRPLAAVEQTGEPVTLSVNGGETFVGDWHATKTWRELPASVRGSSCCEGDSELLLELVFDTPGEHELDGLSIDYTAGPWSYHTYLGLPDEDAETWQIYPPGTTLPPG